MAREYEYYIRIKDCKEEFNRVKALLKSFLPHHFGMDYDNMRTSQGEYWDTNSGEGLVIYFNYRKFNHYQNYGWDFYNEVKPIEDLIEIPLSALELGKDFEQYLKFNLI